MDVAVVNLAGECAGQVGRHGLGLGNLLGLQAITLEHVLEVHVSTDVELVGAVQHDAAVFEQLRHHAVGDGGADLALDVVADDRDAGVLELGSPLRVGSDEDGQSVDECNACVDRALCVELVSVVGTDGQVGDEDVDLSVLECLDDVDGLGVGQLDGLGVVLADAVEGRATLNGNVQGRDVGDLDGVVLAREDRLGEVEADLLGVDVERSDELHVADVVLTELDVHEAGDRLGLVGILVVVDALNQGRGAVTHAHNGYAHRGAVLTHGRVLLLSGMFLLSIARLRSIR